eukprot:1195406-Prorocentrum_minimum.AAC.8
MARSRPLVTSLDGSTYPVVRSFDSITKYVDVLIPLGSDRTNRARHAHKALIKALCHWRIRLAPRIFAVASFGEPNSQV